MDRSLIARGLLYLALCFVPVASNATITLTFTENSSSDLVVTSDTPLAGLGFAVTPQGTDHWHVVVSGGPLLLKAGSVASRQWYEPEDQSKVNRVTWTASFFDVFSEVGILTETNPYVDGFAVGSFIDDLIYTYLDDPADPTSEVRVEDEVLVRFVDKGDSSVPEPGMLSLIGLSLVALGWSRRRRAQG